MDYNTEQQPQMPTGASSKSTSDSISPSVELIVVSDADSEEGNDDMVLSYEENATGFGSNEFSSSNPILQFPFSEPDDDPSAPLHRVLDYLSTRTCVLCFIRHRSSFNTMPHSTNMKTRIIH